MRSAIKLDMTTFMAEVNGEWALVVGEYHFAGVDCVCVKVM